MRKKYKSEKSLSLLFAFWLLLLWGFLPGCAGGGIGAGTATLKATITELEGTYFAKSSTESFPRLIGFDESLIGGGEPVAGVRVRIVRLQDSLDIEATTSEEGIIWVGALSPNIYILTFTGPHTDSVLSFSLLVEAPSALMMKVRLEKDEECNVLLNAQVIPDANGDEESDDGFRLTVEGQSAEGGGTIIIHHSNGSHLPPEDREKRILGRLDADGSYEIIEVIIDTDDDGLANDSLEEEDIDGDAIPDTEDTDIDGDGISNSDDLDIDGDHALNHDDPDVDGDGLINEEDPDADADGIPNEDDPSPLGP